MAEKIRQASWSADCGKRSTRNQLSAAKTQPTADPPLAEMFFSSEKAEAQWRCALSLSISVALEGSR
jgi:hypothetical protein